MTTIPDVSRNASSNKNPKRATIIGSAQLDLKVLGKRFFSYGKRFFTRKKLTPGRVEVICVNLVVFRPVDFHGRFYFFSLRLLRPFWKILSARLLFASVF